MKAGWANRVGWTSFFAHRFAISLKIKYLPAIPAGFPFFSLRAQRKEPKERAARPLRRPRSPRSGTGWAKTRCAQTVCPFDPVPNPAARLSDKGARRPRTPSSSQNNLQAGRAASVFSQVVAALYLILMMSQKMEKHPVLSSRPQGEISGIRERFLPAVEMTEIDVTV